MTFTKEMLDYYRELADQEKHFSWKNTTIAVPMSSMQDLVYEIDRLEEENKNLRAHLVRALENIE